MVKGSGFFYQKGSETICRIRRTHDNLRPLPLADFKALLRDQHSMLLIDQSAALAAIPLNVAWLEPGPRAKAVELIKQVLEFSGALNPASGKRLQEIKDLFTGNKASAAASVISLKPKSSSH